MLSNSPGFTAVAVLTLALGIGANTAIFSVVNAILLRPLPYPNADRLVLVWENNLKQGWNRVGVSGPTYLDWKEQSQSFDDMAVMQPGTGTLTGLGEPEQFAGMRVSANLLELLGAKAILGRTFRAGEGRIGHNNVAVLTHGFWQRRFGSDADIVGKKAIIDGMPYTVIGVLSPSFWLPVPCEAMAAWDNDDLRRQSRSSHELGLVARLKRGVTLEQANAEMRTVARRVWQGYPAMQDWSASVVPMHENLVEYLRPALLVLLGAVGFVLLIGCTNIANLLLARAAARQKETAIRTALGAARARLLRQFLTESVVLSLIGGALGILVAYWGIAVLRAVIPHSIPVPEASAEVLVSKIGMDARVLLFTLLISLASGLVFGLAPALQASRVSVSATLKEGGRSASASHGHARLRGLLVVSEVALALVLLIGAGLMIRSFWRLQGVNPGFNPDHVLTLEIELPTDSKYRQPREQAAVFRQFLEHVQRVPGVRYAALTHVVPLAQADDRLTYLIEGRPQPGSGQGWPADVRRISPDYFRTLGIPLKKGRQFTDRDKEDAPPVLVIDESLARRGWPGNEDPIGRRLLIRSRAFEIVGIVGEVKHSGLNKTAKPTIYFPYLQSPAFRMNLVVRSLGAPETLVRAMKSAIWEVDKDQPVYNVRTIEEILASSQSAPRLTLTLLLAFALVAVLLASLGIYGVMSYTVSRRSHEMGIRMALGAQPSGVLKLVVGQAMVLVLIGLAAGLAAALLLTRALSTLLYGVSATDPLTFVAVSLALAGVALAASYLPARRATKVQPIAALRHE